MFMQEDLFLLGTPVKLFLELHISLLPQISQIRKSKLNRSSRRVMFQLSAAIMRYALSFRAISKKEGSAHQFNLNRAAAYELI